MLGGLLLPADFSVLKSTLKTFFGEFPQSVKQFGSRAGLKLCKTLSVSQVIILKKWQQVTKITTGMEMDDEFSNQTGCHKHEFLNINTCFLNSPTPFSLVP